jgi:hypothetical protein
MPIARVRVLSDRVVLGSGGQEIPLKVGTEGLQPRQQVTQEQMHALEHKRGIASTRLLQEVTDSLRFGFFDLDDQRIRALLTDLQELIRCALAADHQKVA